MLISMINIYNTSHTSYLYIQHIAKIKLRFDINPLMLWLYFYLFPIDPIRLEWVMGTYPILEINKLLVFFMNTKYESLGPG